MLGIRLHVPSLYCVGPTGRASRYIVRLFSHNFLLLFFYISLHAHRKRAAFVGHQGQTVPHSSHCSPSPPPTPPRGKSSKPLALSPPRPPVRAREKKKQADRNYAANNSCHLSPSVTPWPCPFTNPTRFASVISVHSVDSPISKEWRSRFRHPFTRPPPTTTTSPPRLLPPASHPPHSPFSSFRRTKRVNLERRNSSLLASEEILGRWLSEIDGTLIPRQK